MKSSASLRPALTINSAHQLSSPLPHCPSSFSIGVECHQLCLASFAASRLSTASSAMIQHRVLGSRPDPRRPHHHQHHSHSPSPLPCQLAHLLYPFFSKMLRLRHHLQGLCPTRSHHASFIWFRVLYQPSASLSVRLARLVSTKLLLSTKLALAEDLSLLTPINHCCHCQNRHHPRHSSVSNIWSTQQTW